MSALSVLYLVLPFPLAFILHDAEEAIVQHRWMLSHRYIFEDKYPRIKPLFKYLSSLDTQSFVIAALEEFVILILCTCYVLIQGNYCVEIWSALFIAFSFHLLIHIIQAIVLKSYVPGLITSVLLIPYSYLGMQSIWYAMNGVELFLWGVAGIIFMAMNLIFAHWIGKICHKTHFAHNYQKDTMIMDNKRSAIVMGATSGIGHEVALILARRGWRIGVAGRREDILAKMSDEIDGVVAYEVIDVNTPEAVDGLHKLIGKLGGMHLYFHSSGIGYQNTALDAGKELTTIETNCLGMARLVGEAFRYFEQHPETDGQIAVISSISRTKGLGAAPAYSASKRFTSHYLESLCQLTSIRKIHNIHITDIRPGFVKTPLIEGSNFPMQLDARKVAVSIVDGIERRKPVITINWLYRLLVFFWQMIPRSIWIKMKVK